MGFESGNEKEVMIVTGCCLSRPWIKRGGRIWVWPGQQVQRISLRTFTITITSKEVKASNGIPICCTGIGQVAIVRENHSMFESACDHFLGMPEQAIHDASIIALEGHQRSTIGTMTVEDIYKDRKKFAKQVFEGTAAELIQMGITVVSYTLKDVTDTGGYLAALGKQRAAERLKPMLEIHES